MSRSRGSSRLCLFALSAIVLAGCSGSGDSKLVPVKGKVFVGDEPLTRGSISFRLQSPEGASMSEPYGNIEPDGTYTLYTKQKPGAPIGKYYAIVVSTEDVDPNNSATPKSLIDRRYADLENKLLPVEVVENPAPGQYDLKVKK